MAKIITAAEAADLIRDGMTLGVSGFGAFASPDCVMEAMSRKFKEQNTPRDLTIVPALRPAILLRMAAACPRSGTRASSGR